MLEVGDTVKLNTDLPTVHPELIYGLEGRVIEVDNQTECALVDFWATRKIVPFIVLDFISRPIKPVIQPIKEVDNVDLSDDEYLELFDNETDPPKFDPVDKPKHYAHSKFETIEVIGEWGGKEMYHGFMWGNVIKYCSRYKHKNGVEDLKKARFYLDRLIKDLE